MSVLIWQMPETLATLKNKLLNGEIMFNEFAKKRWAVVGFDYDTAKQIIAGIEEHSGKEVSRRIRTKYEIRTEFTDGTLLRWVNASFSSKGQRIGRMWCDKNINKDIFKYMIMPMYMGKREDINWI